MTMWKPSPARIGLIEKMSFEWLVDTEVDATRLRVLHQFAKCCLFAQLAVSKGRQEFAYEREIIAKRQRRRSTLTAIRDVRVSSAARIKFLEHIASPWLVDIEVDARRLPALFAFAK